MKKIGEKTEKKNRKFTGRLRTGIMSTAFVLAATGLAFADTDPVARHQ